MKYKIWEHILTEYTDANGCNSKKVLIDEIEAASHEEAYKASLLRHPQKQALCVDGDGKLYEYRVFGEGTLTLND